MRTTVFFLAMVGMLSAASIVGAAPPRNRGGYRGGRYVLPYHNMKAHKPTPNDPELVAAQAKHLGQLKADLEAIPTGGEPTKAQKTALQQALLGVVDSSQKPSLASVRKLSEDLAGALSRRGRKGFDASRLAHELKTVMNSAYSPMVEIHRAISRGEELLTSSGIAVPQSRAIADDLKAIASAATAQGNPGLMK